MTIILIVEDDFTIALLYEKILETMGIQTISANNGKEAVDLYISPVEEPLPA